MPAMRQLLLDLFGAGNASENFEPNHPPAPAHQAPEAIDSIVHPIEPALDLQQALPPAAFSHPQANRRIVLGDAQVAYAFRRGRRRTIGLTVGAEGLSVSAPRWTPLAEVEALLRHKSRWVLDKLTQARQRQAQAATAAIDWREGARLPYLGQALTLRLDPRQAHGPVGATLQDGCLWLGLPLDAAPERLRDAAQAWLLRQARRLFTARLDHFAPQLGVRWQRLTLSSARTRWGSASADGSIRLNWRLIHFGESIIDYVVVHELAHLREMNHSPRFWDHVEAVLPDYAERRGALRDEAVPRW
ncbi:MAG: M48 family metallopeptidase [Proteobacteria bacterium]|nr:M48 family metallopeptidase [Pseudomonadota bacterium]MBS0415541.1 M48 family metallopeptidase [Pseudomonadota bacterium]